MIITEKHKLQESCEECSLLEASEIIKQLETELKNSSTPGIGLAALQVGILKRVAIIRMSNVKIDLVNPKIIESYDLREFCNEACLSFPGESVTTKRYNEVYIKDDLHPAGLILIGLEAVVAQHEIDHLNKLTMYDRQIEIPGRNKPCWCGSGCKYKKCHLNRRVN